MNYAVDPAHLEFVLDQIEEFPPNILITQADITFCRRHGLIEPNPSAIQAVPIDEWGTFSPPEPSVWWRLTRKGKKLGSAWIDVYKTLGPDRTRSRHDICRQYLGECPCWACQRELRGDTDP